MSITETVTTFSLFYEVYGPNRRSGQGRIRDKDVGVGGRFVTQRILYLRLPD